MIGYLAQLPAYPNKSGRDVLYTAFAELIRLGEAMHALEAEMASSYKLEPLLDKYGALQTRYEQRGGYVIDSKVNAMIDGIRLTRFVDRFTGTLVVVSHDRYFLNKLFPITYWLDGTITRFPGNVAYALEKRVEPHIAEPVSQPKAKIAKPKRPVDTAADEARLNQLEDDHQSLLTQMNDTNDVEELMTLQRQADALQADIDTLLNQLLESI